LKATLTAFEAVSPETGQTIGVLLAAQALPAAQPAFNGQPSPEHAVAIEQPPDEQPDSAEPPSPSKAVSGQPPPLEQPVFTSDASGEPDPPAQPDLPSAEPQEAAATCAQQAFSAAGFSESSAIDRPTTATANTRASPSKTRVFIQNLRSENRLAEFLRCILRGRRMHCSTRRPSVKPKKWSLYWCHSTGSFLPHGVWHGHSRQSKHYFDGRHYRGGRRMDFSGRRIWRNVAEPHHVGPRALPNRARRRANAASAGPHHRFFAKRICRKLDTLSGRPNADRTPSISGLAARPVCGRDCATTADRQAPFLWWHGPPFAAAPIRIRSYRRSIAT